MTDSLRGQTDSLRGQTDSPRGQTDSLRQLSEAGVAIWLDDMSRRRLATDDLADLIRDKHVVGVTTNPTIFQKAITESDLYDRQLRDLAVRGVDVEEAVRMVTTFRSEEHTSELQSHSDLVC